MSIIQQGSVLEDDCLHHVVHLQAQLAAGETYDSGKPWQALLLPAGAALSGSSSYAAAGFSTQVSVVRAVSCHQGTRPAKNN